MITNLRLNTGQSRVAVDEGKERKGRKAGKNKIWKERTKHKKKRKKKGRDGVKRKKKKMKEKKKPKIHQTWRIKKEENLKRLKIKKLQRN